MGDCRVVRSYPAAWAGVMVSPTLWTRQIFSGLADSRVFCIQGSLDTSRDVLHEDVTVTSYCGKVYN